MPEPTKNASTNRAAGSGRTISATTFATPCACCASLRLHRHRCLDDGLGHRSHDVMRSASESNIGPDFGKNRHNPSRDVYKTKADVVKLIQQAVADGANQIQQQGEAGLDKMTHYASGNRLVHNSYTWMFAIEHSGEHYGQLVVYYRANNLAPPDSRREENGLPRG